MAYQYKVNRVTLFGTVYSGAEEWTTGFYLGSPSGDAFAPTQAAADYIKTQWQTFWTLVGNGISNVWKCDGVKISPVNVDGSINKDGVITSYYGTPIAGGLPSNGNPPQIALVASLLAAPGTGLGRKGRMFIPGVGADVANTGKVSGTYPATIATNLGTFFSNLNGSVDVGDSVILASRGRTAPLIGAGVNRVVETVKVGDVFDTQRRRRNQLAETYSTATVNL